MRISNELAWCAPVDASVIDLTEEADLAYWTHAFDCSTHELIDAVQFVGISVIAITAHLKLHVKQTAAVATSP